MTDQPAFMDNALKSVCLMTGMLHDDARTTYGNAVFIGPRHVLANMTCLNQMQNHTFINYNGSTAEIDKTIGIEENAALDICLITLNKSIGINYLETITTQSYSSENIDKGWLISKFGNHAAEAEPTILNKHMTTALRDPRSEIISEGKIDFKLLAVFNTEMLQTGAGFGGAPVINTKGQIISLDSHSAYQTEQEYLRSVQQAGQYIQNPTPFIGPHPYEFAEWMDKVLPLLKNDQP